MSFSFFRDLQDLRRHNMLIFSQLFPQTKLRASRVYFSIILRKRLRIL